MKKEIGKWLMDIAKYVVTGGIISTFISNYQQQSWIIYINAAIVAIIIFGRVPAILRKEKGLKTVKKEEIVMGPYLFFCSIVVIPCVVYLIYSYTHTNKNNIMDSDK